MGNSNKIILDLCGGTGAMSNPYGEAGYNVKVITLPEYDITRTELYMETIVFSGNNNLNGLSVNYKNIYGILAAPPCTQFSFARNEKRAKLPRDLKKGLIVVDACLRIIRRVLLKGALQFWVMENPKGHLRRFLGKPFLEFNPCDYGDAWTKPTDIWGFFNNPKKNAVTLAGGPDRWTDNGRFTAADNSSPNCTDEYFRKVRGERRIIRRSITPPGFAKAFYRANK